MEFIADIHIHSHYSRATSRQLDLEHLWIEAQRKGVTVVGTGDFTHPGWYAELSDKLQPTGDGLFRLKPELSGPLVEQVPGPCRAPVRFLLSVEISNIYKRDEATRKVHNVVCMPDLDQAAALNAALARIGNIHSDGRPILGLDSRDLLEMVLQTGPGAVLIPAHIWTPWFSALGSRSGFDSVEACYADLADEIFALETGLSSDPPMNWRLSGLDRYTLVSNSDAHSPAKLGREATLFCGELSYAGIFDALRRRQDGGYGGTLEFFPEEGKYHFDGHRKCDVRLTPPESLACGGICPVCGKPLVLGVMHRVEALADRPEGFRPDHAAPFESLVSLDGVLSEVFGVGPASVRVRRARDRLVRRLGNELTLLRHVPLEELVKEGGPVLGEAIRRMRVGEVELEGGYDGEYGKVRLVDAAERAGIDGQATLFALDPPKKNKKKNPPVVSSTTPLAPTPPASPAQGAGRRSSLSLFDDPPSPGFLDGLNPRQREAAEHSGGPLIIVAGPGTGKTRTLTRRIAARVDGGMGPDSVLAVTFTHKAAGELRERLVDLLGQERGSAVRVNTFHALALTVLSDHNAQKDLPPPEVIDDDKRLDLLQKLNPSPQKGAEKALARGDDVELVMAYREILARRGAVDLIWLVSDAVTALSDDVELLTRWRGRCQLVCVDEYQDVNADQVALLRLLCPPGSEICAIGDPDQAIYTFRGADAAFFFRFDDDFGEAKKFMLSMSYRTAAPILAAAQGLIAHNPQREPMETISEQPGADGVVLYRAPSVAAEAEFVVHTVERLVGGTTFFSHDSGRLQHGGPEADLGPVSFGDVAVLYRTRAQAGPLLEAFGRSGIPHGCQVAADEAEQVLEPLLRFVRRQQAQADPDEQDEPELRRALADLAPRQGLDLLVNTLCPRDDRAAARDLTLGLAAQISRRGGLDRWGPQLLGLARTMAGDDSAGPRAESVSLLTLHAAKGLEFAIVFIVGCQDGLLPFGHGGRVDEASVPEERRLMYVGMTRAERQLFLSHVQTRGDDAPRRPSRFVAELPAELLHPWRPDRPKRRARQLSLFD